MRTEGFDEGETGSKSRKQEGGQLKVRSPPRRQSRMKKWKKRNGENGPHRTRRLPRLARIRTRLLVLAPTKRNDVRRRGLGPSGLFGA